MSNQANIDLLETIFEEVQEAFPYLDEEKQIEIANNRFWEIAQWTSKTRSGGPYKKWADPIHVYFTAAEKQVYILRPKPFTPILYKWEIF